MLRDSLRLSWAISTPCSRASSYACDELHSLCAEAGIDVSSVEGEQLELFVTETEREGKKVKEFVCETFAT